MIVDERVRYVKLRASAAADGISGAAPGGVHLAVLVGVDERARGQGGRRGGRGALQLHGAAAAD